MVEYIRICPLFVVNVISTAGIPSGIVSAGVLNTDSGLVPTTGAVTRTDSAAQLSTQVATSVGGVMPAGGMQFFFIVFVFV